jgi:hypothetical protein
MVNIEIDDKKLPVSLKTLTTLLKFLYSGNVNFFKMDITEVFELLLAAKTYELINLIQVSAHKALYCFIMYCALEFIEL